MFFKKKPVFFFLVFCNLLVWRNGLLAYPISDHFDGDIFFNEAKIERRGLLQVFRWWLSDGKKRWPKDLENSASPSLPLTIPRDQIFVTFVNHASFLIQLDGINLLTDPIFSERASPFTFFGAKRVRPPGITLDLLPPIHYVMISHNHYDHLDLPSLKELWERFHPQFLVPLGDADLLRSQGIENVVELDWWQSMDLNPRGAVTLVPCQHWSARGLTDRAKSLWGGYFVAVDDWKVLFQGDTGYNSFFSKMKERLGPVDLSILPIGAYEPRWFMKDVHMNPEEAVQAHIDLGSRLSIASHFGTFQLTDEGIDDPPLALQESLKKHKLSKEVFQVLEVGQTIAIPKGK